jgi:hypothetical protein
LFGTAEGLLGCYPGEGILGEEIDGFFGAFTDVSFWLLAMAFLGFRFV